MPPETSPTPSLPHHDHSWPLTRPESPGPEMAVPNRPPLPRLPLLFTSFINMLHDIHCLPWELLVFQSDYSSHPLTKVTPALRCLPSQCPHLGCDPSHSCTQVSLATRHPSSGGS